MHCKHTPSLKTCDLLKTFDVFMRDAPKKSEAEEILCVEVLMGRHSDRDSPDTPAPADLEVRALATPIRVLTGFVNHVRNPDLSVGSVAIITRRFTLSRRQYQCVFVLELFHATAKYSANYEARHKRNQAHQLLEPFELIR